MARFIRKILLFVIIPYAFLFIIGEILLRHIPNTYSYKKKYLNENAEKIETLIFGGSNGFYNVNPQYLSSKGFNAAYMAQSLDFDYEILKKYDKKLTRLQWIILPVSYTSLVYHIEKWRESWRIHNYYIYYGIENNHNIKDNFELLSASFRTNINKLIAYYIYRINPHRDYSDLGWGWDHTYENREDLLATGKMWSELQTFKGTSIDSNLKIVKSIIEYAKQRNIKVLMFIEPAYITYIERLDKAQLNTTLQAAEELPRLYNNAHYYNFLTDSSFTDADFHDADHLDEFGSKKLTLRLDSIINKLSVE